MKHASMPRLMAPVVVACSLFAAQAEASTRAVNFNVLNASATLASPLNAGDTLVQNTLVISEVGALLQNITFSLASGVEALTGYAAWQISTAAGTGPRLIGVNIDLFDAGNVTGDQRHIRGHVGRICAVPPSIRPSARAPTSWSSPAPECAPRLSTCLSNSPAPPPARRLRLRATCRNLRPTH